MFKVQPEYEQELTRDCTEVFEELNTKIIYAAAKISDPKEFLDLVHKYVRVSGAHLAAAKKRFVASHISAALVQVIKNEKIVRPTPTLLKRMSQSFFNRSISPVNFRGYADKGRTAANKHEGFSQIPGWNEKYIHKATEHIQALEQIFVKRKADAEKKLINKYKKDVRGALKTFAFQGKLQDAADVMFNKYS